MANRPITVAHGDGIGPEIMDATLRILTEADARIVKTESRRYFDGQRAYSLDQGE